MAKKKRLITIASVFGEVQSELETEGQAASAQKDTFTIQELALAATRGDEGAIRRLLNEAGASPELDETKEDPSETVPHDLVHRLTVRLFDLDDKRAATELSWLLRDRDHGRTNTLYSLEARVCPHCQQPIGVGSTREQGYIGFINGHE